MFVFEQIQELKQTEAHWMLLSPGNDTKLDQLSYIESLETAVLGPHTGLILILVFVSVIFTFCSCRELK